MNRTIHVAFRRQRICSSTTFSALAMAAVMALMGQGCARPYDVATPDGFVDLSHRYESAGNDEYRASTPDGVVLRARAYPNEPKVTTDVAVKVLESRIRLGQGYALLGEKDVTARDGSKGKMLQFGHDEDTGPHLYYVTLFIAHDRVYILDAGGKKDLVEAAENSIAWWIKSFFPK
jgi:hypothetical protein